MCARMESVDQLRQLRQSFYKNALEPKKE